ncbi:unnamed protein product, partial [Mesorhabditis spiculigera]
MEEDNAGDVSKFLNGLELGDDPMHVTIYGNLLLLNSVSRPMEPLIFVMERFTMRKDSAEQSSCSFPFSINFADELLQLYPTTSEQREKLMLRLATCSHSMAAATMDELAYKLFTMQIPEVPDEQASHGSAFQNYYLSNPFAITHNFSIANKLNFVARHIAYKEVMWETKLSIALPLELLKLFRKFGKDFTHLLEAKQSQYPLDDIPALQDVLRHARDNLEIYEQCIEFLTSHSGPNFRPSVEKTRVAFAPVPTNLHIQYFNVAGEAPKCIITAGTASCLPLRFAHGGLEKLTGNLKIGVQWTGRSYESKQSEISEIKKEIGEMSHRLEGSRSTIDEGAFYGNLIELTTGIKQIRERLNDLTKRIPDADALSNSLLFAAKSRQRKEKLVPDAITNQFDALNAQVISLDTKLATMDVMADDKESVADNTRSAVASCLDAELLLAESLAECLLLGFIRAVHHAKAGPQFFHIQLRLDFVLSQTITIAATAMLTRVEQGWPMLDGQPLPPLLIIFSWLSAYGDEWGMLEDATEAWSTLSSLVAFKFVQAPSSVSRSCVPIVSGKRNHILVCLPLPHDVFNKLPEAVKRPEGWRMQTAYFNLAQQWGGPALEAHINHTALLNIETYAYRLQLDPSAKEALAEFSNTVKLEPSRKNVEIFERLMAVSECLGAQVVIGCKSGKDRTSMGLTLEQGRRLRETHGLDQNQVMEIVTCLRKDGVRRENCRKNIGKKAYAFSPFQMHFLPKSLRPPSGTYAANASS